jgi:hypothetical protein
MTRRRPSHIVRMPPHLAMQDAGIVMDVTDASESELRIEAFQMSLGVDPDRAPRIARFGERKRLVHQGPPHALRPPRGRHDNAADRWLFGALSGWHQASASHQLSRRRAGQDMPALQIEDIGIAVETTLLEEKHILAQAQHLIDLNRRQHTEVQALPADVEP